MLSDANTLIGLDFVWVSVNLRRLVQWWKWGLNLRTH